MEYLAHAAAAAAVAVAGNRRFVISPPGWVISPFASRPTDQWDGKAFVDHLPTKHSSSVPSQKRQNFHAEYFR